MKNFKEDLNSLKDEEYKKFNAKLCPDTKKKMLGIRIPKLRNLAKSMLKEEEWKELVDKLDDEYF